MIILRVFLLRLLRLLLQRLLPGRLPGIQPYFPLQTYLFLCPRKKRSRMRLHAGSGSDVILPLPYGRMTYTGSKGRARSPSQPLAGRPQRLCSDGTGTLYHVCGSCQYPSDGSALSRICIFIVRPIDDGKTVVYHCGAMKENQ